MCNSQHFCKIHYNRLYFAKLVCRHSKSKPNLLQTDEHSVSVLEWSYPNGMVSWKCKAQTRSSQNKNASPLKTPSRTNLIPLTSKGTVDRINNIFILCGIKYFTYGFCVRKIPHISFLMVSYLQTKSLSDLKPLFQVCNFFL